MRVGILTGGGDCPGLNAAISGVARTLINQCNAEIIGIEDGFLGLLERRTFPIQNPDCRGLIRTGGTLLGTCNRVSPLNYNGQNMAQTLSDYYRELNLDCIVALGGDGTMSLCHALYEQVGIPFVGVPKTIDNDLMHTDRSFGFDTAVNIVAESLDRLHTTGHSHHRVMLVETMGRYAGWIGLYGGVAGDADVILLPEFPYEMDEVVRAIRQCARHKSYSVVVVAEGAFAQKGQHKLNKTVADSPDPVRLGGVAHVLQAELEKVLGLEVRATVLGHVQRGGQPTAFDRIFATNLGCYAAQLVIRREFNRMVCVSQNTLSSVELAAVANQTRTITMDDMTLIGAIQAGISFGVPNLQKTLNSFPQVSPKLR
jgi:ATP-dependent phosphofructokinase / diphosphate-dependent phosphofructokinase